MSNKKFTKQDCKMRVLIPNMRFPEFFGAKWEMKQIGDFLIESRLPGSTGDVAKKITVKLWGNGVFEKNEVVQGSVNTQYFRRKAGQFIYSKLDFLNQAFGIIPKNLDGFESTVDLPCFDVDEGLNARFLLEYVKRKDFYERLGETADGSRKARRIHAETFLAFSIAVPSTAEQQKIADCLSSIDDLISAEAKKLDTLKTYKKGLMQSLFPSDGEIVPNLRFAEFHNAGRWERKKLSELLFETKQKNKKLEYGPQHVLSVSGEYGCVNQIEHLGRSYAGASVINYGIVESGDIVYTKSPLKNNPFGIIKVNKGSPGIVSTLYAVYRTTDMGSPNYLDQYFARDHHLNSYLQPLVKKGAKNDMKVNNSVVLSGEISVPSIEEQRKIADCLISLDKVIAVQVANIAMLKTHKKGLAQRLFPNLDEAKV